MRNAKLLPMLFLLAVGFGVGGCYAQSTLSSIGRVETTSGSGTGFIASEDQASDTPTYEIWTAGHVVDRVGQNVAVRFDAGRKGETLVVGTVTYRKYEGEYDAAIIECQGKPPRSVLRIANAEAGDVAYFAGYSSRFRWRALRIVSATAAWCGRNRFWVPPPSQGESGAPVWTEAGVHGVVTGFVTANRRMIMHPISQWIDR